MEDYADKELRGFIEGFYGGFSYEDRETQIRFLRKVKGNMYVFASKTDPYHGGSNWQAQYPQEELNQIKHLVDVAKASKVRYAWSFHAGKSAF
ncbi:beta-N-acetylglucosaminidase domain-containing protein [Allobaculum sp. Allo2]|uniref:beta-N-acetylglucosaminidase domain-containing protein n=1 Tax=Allobaculum sp. Allo2 TaxID=2853432 RepID=UPI003462B6A3|nr:beta-N-acetylglucosaminidase domain-containing protein [Allobaculum sp. Allo2]